MIANALEVAVGYAWGWPLIVLLVGGGSYLTVKSRLLPFVTLKHAVDIVRGKFDDPNDPGEISHFRALTTALAATVGVSNIAGVAIAISTGGPGSIFWMWVTAVVGMATKFFTCTLSTMYRANVDGVAQGGPMYYIELGLGPKFRFLAVAFSVFGLVGCLALFQSNQLAKIVEHSFGVSTWTTGVLTAILVGAVVLGGIHRIGAFTSRLVPTMCGLYILSAGYVIVSNITMVPSIFVQIVSDAFTGHAMVGGAVGTVIMTGIKRAAFSNEAGIGTAPMAHGAAKTKEPVREGLVAMMGPLIDTIVVCSMTAFVILLAGNWQGHGIQGVELTANAFEQAFGAVGPLLVTISVILFGVSTMVGYSYYGKKCFSYLFGRERERIYDWIFVASLVLGAVWSADAVINLLDTAFALMAIPNMIAALLLAPKVMEATRDYLDRHSVWRFGR